MAKVNFSRKLRILRAGVSLKCPRCRGGGLFDGWFHMFTECSRCGLKFEREQGFFVGAIYVNYAVTVLIALPGFFLLDYYAEVSLRQQLILWGAFATVFPILFFRHSRSLWLSVAYLFDPDDETRLRLVPK
jgi:uncharacterized protein (DUF983 family)